ncbi:MAG: UDP-N-acetylmuramoyl-tripeptide--D-alanyl-D-alanine ligase [Bacteroidota bacterium]|nr:UDP-N-acetylmuramoyl-tripeptide--D-alanyl-D-alanine ligase [Bacteroidota bacterium]
MEISEIYKIFEQSTGVCTDTRKIEKGNLFFALKGPNFNGNQYAQKAFELGASFCVIDEAAFSIPNKTIMVNDCLEALQQLANYHRRQLQIPIIGIAGSNGKTTTKELIYSVLSTTLKTFATKGNLNNHIGVPLTLLSIDKSVQIAAIELGANHVGELELLCKIAEPNFGIITNNGLDHLEGYGSFEGVVKGNSELYYWLLTHNGVAFVNSTDELLVRMASRFNNAVYYGSQKNKTYTTVESGSILLKLKSKTGKIIDTQLIGSYNIHNINAALCIADYFEIDENVAIEAIKNYVPSNNRSQLVSVGTNQVVLDCYNANPSSMESSIESFSKIDAANKVLMLGDMFELGNYSSGEHRKLIEFCQKHSFSDTYYCGKEFSLHKNDFKMEKFFETREMLEAHLKSHPIQNATILIKGSRGMAMEKLLDYLK